MRKTLVIILALIIIILLGKSLEIQMKSLKTQEKILSEQKDINGLLKILIDSRNLKLLYQLLQFDPRIQG